MKDVNKVFFAIAGQRGITTTSANHICNVAKEVINELNNEIQRISFVTTTVEALSSTPSVIMKGSPVESLTEIDNKLKTIAELTSLIAWLREGIKAKNFEVEDVKVSQGFPSLMASDLNCEEPQRPQSIIPLKGVNTDFGVSKLSLKERLEYYTIEASATVYGKCIHPGYSGNFYESRRKLLDALKTPSNVTGDSKNLVIYRSMDSISPSIVHGKFAQLQSDQRSFEARLNAIKHKIDSIVNEENLRIANLNNIAEAKYISDQKAYVSALEELSSRHNIHVLEQTKILSQLKLVIPERLECIFDYISDLGKVEK